MTDVELKFMELLNGGLAELIRPCDEFGIRCEFEPINSHDGLPFRVINGAWRGVAYLTDDCKNVRIEFRNHPTGDVDGGSDFIFLVSE